MRHGSSWFARHVTLAESFAMLWVTIIGRLDTLWPSQPANIMSMKTMKFCTITEKTRELIDCGSIKSHLSRADFLGLCLLLEAPKRLKVTSPLFG